MKNSVLGFTLIEMMIVVAIIGIIATVVVPIIQGKDVQYAQNRHELIINPCLQPHTDDCAYFKREVLIQKLANE